MKVSSCCLREGERANLFHLHPIFGTVLQPGLAIDQKLQPSPEAFQAVYGDLAVGIDGAGFGSTQVSQESYHRVQVWQWQKGAILVDWKMSFAAEPASIS